MFSIGELARLGGVSVRTLRRARRLELRVERAGQAHSWQLMRDPAGLVFCVIPEPPGELNDSNARRWD